MFLPGQVMTADIFRRAVNHHFGFAQAFYPRLACSDIAVPPRQELRRLFKDAENS